MVTLLLAILAVQADAISKKAIAAEAEGDYLKAARVWRAAKGEPARERLSACLEKAWEAAEDKAPLRRKLLEFAAPPADYQKGKASSVQAAGWYPLSSEFGSTVDARFAFEGGRSLKLLPAVGGKDNKDGWSSAETLQVPLGKASRVKASAWIFAYGTDGGGKLSVHFDDASGKRISTSSVPVVGDLPIWKRYVVEVDVPQGASLSSLRVDVKITKGAVWVDEVNVTDGVRELFMGGGFER